MAIIWHCQANRGNAHWDSYTMHMRGHTIKPLHILQSKASGEPALHANVTPCPPPSFFPFPTLYPTPSPPRPANHSEGASQKAYLKDHLDVMGDCRNVEVGFPHHVPMGRKQCDLRRGLFLQKPEAAQPACKGTRVAS